MDLFLPIKKVDEEQRLVYGVMAEEVPDHSSEVFDYATSKPNFEKWSSEFQKNTDGKSWGNVRAMHGNIAAGRLNQMAFDDDARKIEAVAHIVDDNEWNKVKQGVYTGFSIGGRYAKRWADETDAKLTRYTAEPNEVSLVDKPCVPTATFSMIKSDGAVEERHFDESVQVDPLEKVELHQVWTCGIHGHEHPAKDEARKCVSETAEALRKGDEVKGVRDEFLTAIGLEKAEKTKTEDGKKFPASDYAYTPDKSKPSTWKLRLTSEPGGEPDARIVGAAAAALGPGYRGNKVEIPESDRAAVVKKVRAAWKKANPDKSEDDMPEALKANKADGGGDMQKGMWTVARLAGLLEELNDIQQSAELESQYEGDNSPVPEELKARIKDLAAVLVNMTQEETKELTGGDDVEVLEASDSKGDLKKDEEPAMAKQENPDDLVKGDKETLQKVLTLLESMTGDKQPDDLQKADLKKDEELGELRKVVESIKTENETLQKRVTELEAEPAAPKGAVMAVSKESEDPMAKQAKAIDPHDTVGLIKAAQSQPMKLV